MITSYPITMTITRLKMTGHLFDTVIVALTNKEWLY